MPSAKPRKESQRKKKQTCRHPHCGIQTPELQKTLSCCSGLSFFVMSVRAVKVNHLILCGWKADQRRRQYLLAFSGTCTVDPNCVCGVKYLSNCPLWRLNSRIQSTCRLERHQKTSEQDGSTTQPQLEAKDLTVSMGNSSKNTCSRKTEGCGHTLSPSRPDPVPWPMSGWWVMFRLGLLHMLLTSGNVLRHAQKRLHPLSRCLSVLSN